MAKKKVAAAKRVVLCKIQCLSSTEELTTTYYADAETFIGKHGLNDEDFESLIRDWYDNASVGAILNANRFKGFILVKTITTLTATLLIREVTETVLDVSDVTEIVE